MRFISLEELLKQLDKYKHKELHVHHTWKPDHEDFNGKNHIQLQRGMRNYHVNTRGWSDIGQHITIFPDGKIVTGRDFGRIPASITGKNTGSFMIENIGNFDLGHDLFAGEQLKTLLAIAKYFDKKGRYIRFHRENSGKSCPGSGIDKTVFMNKVRGGNMVLKKGSQGNSVKVLQNNLIKLGFGNYMKPYGSDSHYGNATVSAVKAFQKSVGLSQDGIYGPNTSKKLNEKLIQANTKPKYPSRGSKGNEVKQLQKDLNVLGYGLNIDGMFGPATEKALVDFQSNNKLSQDGIYGPKSSVKLKQVLKEGKFDGDRYNKLLKEYKELENKYKHQIDNTTDLANKLEDYEETLNRFKRMLEGK